MTEIDDYWAHNVAEAEHVAQIVFGERKAVSDAIAYFRDKAVSVITSENSTYRDCLREAMEGRLKMETSKAHIYGVHLSHPFRKRISDWFCDNNVYVQALLEANAPHQFGEEKSVRRQALEAKMQKEYLPHALKQYENLCRKVLDRNKNNRTILVCPDDEEQEFIQPPCDFGVSESESIPTQAGCFRDSMDARGISWRDTGFPNPRYLPALRDVRGGIFPHTPTLTLGSQVNECLNWVPLFEIGNRFGICLMPSTTEDRSQIQQHGIHMSNIKAIVEEMRLLDSMRAHQHTIPKVDARLAVGFDASGKWEELQFTPSSIAAVFHMGSAVFPKKQRRELQRDIIRFLDGEDLRMPESE